MSNISFDTLTDFAAYCNNNGLPTDYAENIIFKKQFDLREESHTIRKIHFKNCSFNGKLRVVNFNTIEKPNHHITFENCTFFSGLDFYRVNLNVVDIKGVIIKNGGLLIESSKISIFRCSLSECDRLWITGGGNYKSMVFGRWGENNIDSVTIDFDGLDANLQIKLSNIHSFGINGALSSGSFDLRKSTVTRLKFETFINNAKFLLRDIRPEKDESAVFTVLESNLGTLEIFDIDFTDYSFFTIKSSNLTEIRFNNTTWPTLIQAPVMEMSEEGVINLPKNIKDAEKLMQRETYRQLKHASIKQGDSISETFFHKLEMNTYYSTLSWKKNTWTKAILYFSNRFGTYGTNFRQPFWGLLSTHAIVMTILVLLGYKGYSFELKNPNWQATSSFWGEYFNLLNPVHKFDESLTGLWVAADLLIRIYTSFFLYNLVRASRRFVR